MVLAQKEMHAAFCAGLLWKLMYNFWIFARELIFHSRLQKTLTKFYRYVLNETVTFLQQRSYFGLFIEFLPLWSPFHRGGVWRKFLSHGQIRLTTSFVSAADPALKKNNKRINLWLSLRIITANPKTEQSRSFDYSSSVEWHGCGAVKSKDSER